MRNDIIARIGQQDRISVVGNTLQVLPEKDETGRYNIGVRPGDNPKKMYADDAVDEAIELASTTKQGSRNYAKPGRNVIARIGREIGEEAKGYASEAYFMSQRVKDGVKNFALERNVNDRVLKRAVAGAAIVYMILC